MDEGQKRLNDRFRILLATESLTQTNFNEVTGYNSRKVSKILRGETKNPGADFFEVIIQYFPHWNLRWLLLGEGDMFVTKGAVSYVGTVDKVLGDMTAAADLQKENERLKAENEQLKKWLADKERIIELLQKG